MNLIARHIEYLAMTHDCIVVPGLGSFLAHNLPARVEDNVFVAPCRKLTFNPDLQQGDNLLVKSVSREKSIDNAQAQQLVEQEIAELRDRLARNGHVSLGRLGYLMQSSADAPVRFTPASDNTINLTGSWFPDICVSDYVATAPAVHMQPRGNKVSKFRSYMAGVARYAAAAVVLAIIGFAASTPLNIDNAQLASLVPQPKAAQPAEYVYTPSVKCPVIVLQYDRTAEVDTVTKVDVTENATAVQQPKNKEINITKQTVKPATGTATAIDWRMVDSDSFCVVIASLTTAEDAAEYVSSAAKRGQTCGVLEQDGRFRIYAATAPSHSQAQQMLNSLSHKHKGAWICRR